MRTKNGNSCAIIRTIENGCALSYMWQHGDTRTPTFELCNCGFIGFFSLRNVSCSQRLLSLSSLASLLSTLLTLSTHVTLSMELHFIDHCPYTRHSYIPWTSYFAVHRSCTHEAHVYIPSLIASVGLFRLAPIICMNTLDIVCVCVHASVCNTSVLHCNHTYVHTDWKVHCWVER